MERQVETLIGIGLVTVNTIGIIYIIGNDITGVGIMDNFMIQPLATGIGKGLILIF